MSIAQLFPEVPSRQFQAVDTTAGSADAASIMSGSTSAGASRPLTAGANRPVSPDSRRMSSHSVTLSSAVKDALQESHGVSAADCWHACHAHLSDPENFWKTINDACVLIARSSMQLSHCFFFFLCLCCLVTLFLLQVCNLWHQAGACFGARPPVGLAKYIQPDALRRVLPAGSRKEGPEDGGGDAGGTQHRGARRKCGCNEWLCLLRCIRTIMLVVVAHVVNFVIACNLARTSSFLIDAITVAERNIQWARL